MPIGGGHVLRNGVCDLTIASGKCTVQADRSEGWGFDAGFRLKLPGSVA